MEFSGDREVLLQAGIHDSRRDRIVEGTDGDSDRPRGIGSFGQRQHSGFQGVEASGADVKPVVHEKWDGRDIRYADDPELRLSPATFPALRDNPDVATMSTGEGRYRQVLVVPKGAPEYEQARREAAAAASRTEHDD